MGGRLGVPEASVGGAPADSLRRGGTAVKAVPKTDRSAVSKRNCADRGMITQFWVPVLSLEGSWHEDPTG
jgi:hypothetical protein